MRTTVAFSAAELAQIEAGNERVLAELPEQAANPEDPAYLVGLRGDRWWYEPRSADAVDEEVEGIRVRIFDPGEARATYVRIHGGGWVYGAYDAEDVYSWRLARQAGVAVVSVDQRLAPENPWPAPNDDCEAVTRWALGHGGERFGAAPVFVGGESSGAHLALVTALRIRDAGLSLAGANLVAGLYDLGGVPSVRQFQGPDPLGLSEPVVQWYVRCYLGGSVDRRHPDVSPLWAELAGLPPVLLSSGRRDPLIDHSHFLAGRLELAAVETRLDLYPAALHGFEILNPIQAARFHARVADWIGACLASPGMEVATGGGGDAGSEKEG